LGLTATPLRDDNRETYQYFGNPLYTYSLRQGIEDGFLAPYVLHRIVSEPDAAGWRPTYGQRDAKGQVIPDGLYTTPDFENTISILPRTRAVAKHLFKFMHKYGVFDKTIVFCHDESHADDFRREFSNIADSIVRQHPNYCVRITTSEGDIGRGFLSKFMDIEQPLPVVVTTSKLLSTGIDAQTCKNIVIFRNVGSMTEFKQIIGRGTRVRIDKNKFFFTVLDYTGSASRNFADPNFDGEPPLISEELIDLAGEPIPDSKVEYRPPDDSDKEEDDFDDGTSGITRIKYRVEDGEMGIAYETIQVLDANGKLRVVSLIQYTQETVTTLFSNVEELKAHWVHAEKREVFLETLVENGISLEHLQETLNLPDADVLDVLCFVAFNLKPLTRKQRVEYIEKNKPDFFSSYSEKAKNVLHSILVKYVEFGNNQLQPNVINVNSFSVYGNPLEIVNEFGGFEEFTKAMNQLQNLLYAA
jgi:type I restriction enzyme R subunit